MVDEENDTIVIIEVEHTHAVPKHKRFAMARMAMDLMAYPDQSDEGRRRRLGHTPGAAAHGASSASSAATWPRRTSRSRQIVSTSR